MVRKFYALIISFLLLILAVSIDYIISQQKDRSKLASISRLTNINSPSFSLSYIEYSRDLTINRMDFIYDKK